MRTGLASVAFLACSQAAPARAEAKTVLVLGSDPSFRSAMSVALSPWSLRVVPTEQPAPPAVLPRAAHDAQTLAQRFHAAGVVWITSEGGEAALWAYDPATEQVVSRPLATPPPFDAPTAASAALTVKTLLRASTVAPPEERLGAEVARPPPPVEGPPPPAAETPRPAEAPRGAAGQLEVGFAARAVAGDVDARASVGGALWLGASRRLGVGASVRFGPGLGVDGDRFRGRFDEIGIAPTLRTSLPLGSVVAVEPRLGPTLHLTRITGVTLPAGEGAREGRVDVSLDAGVALDVAIAPQTRVGLEVEGAYVLRYQRYLVHDVSVLELAPLQGSAGLRLVTRWP